MFYRAPARVNRSASGEEDWVYGSDWQWRMYIVRFAADGRVVQSEYD